MSGRDRGGAVEGCRGKYLLLFGSTRLTISGCTQSAFAQIHPYESLFGLTRLLRHYWLLDLRSETRLLDNSFATN
jgi:hypothetical protein